MANLYKQYMRLLNKWPLDEAKAIDLGQHIRDQVRAAFIKGENTKIEDKEKCKRYYESLDRIASNYYSKKYPCEIKKTSTGLAPEICREALNKEFLEYLQVQKLGFFAKIVKKLKDTFTSSSSSPKS